VDRSSPANNVYDAGTDIQDFEAILVVWRETNVTIPGPSGPVTITDPNIAITLNLEVSWPAQLPYAQRQKSFLQQGTVSSGEVECGTVSAAFRRKR